MVKMLTVEAVIFVLCALARVTMQAYVMPPPDAHLHVYALPVGQGDATVIQCPIAKYGDQSHVSIVDMGSTSRQNAEEGITYMTDPEIRNFLGAAQVDYVFLTHGDRDHYNILPNIANVNLVQHVYIGCSRSDYRMRRIREWLSAAYTARKLTTFSTHGCTTDCYPTSVAICGCSSNIGIRVMGANLDVFDLGQGCTNGDSLVLRLEYGNFRLLLPGDLEDYSGFTYDTDGYITSNVLDDNGNSFYRRPGILRRLINNWNPSSINIFYQVHNTAPSVGIAANFYRLAHHGTWPHGNKPFFLEAIQPHYAFSSSQLPGTPGTHNHPNCQLYDSMISMTRNQRIPIQRVYGSALQMEYSCGLAGERYHESDNVYGIYTTAVSDSRNVFHNYIIKMDTDGTVNHHIGPKSLRV